MNIETLTDRVAGAMISGTKKKVTAAIKKDAAKVINACLDAIVEMDQTGDLGKSITQKIEEMRA